MPRDRREEPGEASRAAPHGGGEGEGGYGQDDSHGVRGRRRTTRSRSRSPRRRRPAAEDFYRVRGSPGRHDSDSHSHSHSQKDRHNRKQQHRRHRSRDAAGSRSPAAAAEDEGDRKRHHRHHRRHRDKPQPKPTTAPAPSAAADLPYGARPLSYKHDLDALTPLFAYYLDVQKNLDLYGLDAQQARGRWKSFVNRWNRGELAEGWYDPEMFERVSREARPPPAAAAGHDDDYDVRHGDARGGYGAGGEQGTRRRQDREGHSSASSDDGARDLGDSGVRRRPHQSNNDDSDSNSDYGPPPPPGQSSTSGVGARKGPGIPTMSDLALQRESAAEERESRLDDLRQARRADRALQKERLEELAPRAEPGTRERRLEKKAAVNEKMKGFRENDAQVEEEVGDGDLMGGGDSVAELKRAKAAVQRKKTERELRREAEARAREEERLERLREWREREEEKLRGLKELARARFG